MFFMELVSYSIIWPRREKTCLRWFANNTGADQPTHPRSLTSAFVIRILKKKIICKLATGEVSIFQLVPVAEEMVCYWLCWKPGRQVLSRRGQYISTPWKQRFTELFPSFANSVYPDEQLASCETSRSGCILFQPSSESLSIIKLLEK